MSQHDFNIANQGFPATRADLNNALAALASTSSGDTEPSTTYANQLWYDTSNNLLKFRNEADSAWITFAYLDQASNEWEIRSAVIQAVDSAGVVIKTDDGTTRLTVADDGSVTFANDVTVTGTISASNVPSVGAFSSRSKIINGSMTIDQRHDGSAVTYGSQAYITDRFSVGKNSLSTLVATAQQVSDAPDGFQKSLKTTVTTAEASGASSYFIAADYRIEGYDFADFSFGAAGAKTFTLSFWVKASVTGTYCVSFFNADVSRAYLATYSVSSANTWEYKTITVSGDTSGTWNITNGIGLGAQFTVGGGSDQEGTAGAWGDTYKRTVSGAVDLNATLNATWQITGVSLEVGDTATPFEHRSISDELARCRRYYQRISGTYGSTQGLGTGFGSSNTVTTVDIFPPVKELLRGQSAVSFSAASLFTINTNAISANATNISAATYSNNHVRVQITATSDSSTLSSARLVRFNSVNAFVDWDSEL